MSSTDGFSMKNDFSIKQLIMESFKLGNANTSFFMLSNYGFHNIFYEKDIRQLSIDKVSGKDYDGNSVGFKDILEDMLRDVVLGKHMDVKHHGDDADYFDTLKEKTNQLDDNFSTFSLIPTEFGMT